MIDITCAFEGPVFMELQNQMIRVRDTYFGYRTILDNEKVPDIFRFNIPAWNPSDVPGPSIIIKRVRYQ